MAAFIFFKEANDSMTDYRIETKCLQSGYRAENGQPHIVPICQSTTFDYQSAAEVGDLFDLKVEGHFYSRLSNPTVAEVEKKIAALEGGVAAVMTSAGQAASLVSIINITSAGQNFICFSTLYGGTVNLFAVTLKRFGIEARFVDDSMSDEEIEALIDDNTRLVFGETEANPALKVLDIEHFARLAHRHQLPLVIDNTFPTPVLCRPIEFGADIVVHSTTKYMDGHATVVGGVVVDSGRFDWKAATIDTPNGPIAKYPELTTPDESYHGIVYTDTFGPTAFAVKARVQLLRDLGCVPQATAAFLLDMGLETLAVRMERHSENALRVAKYLKLQPQVNFVCYPGLPDDDQYEKAQKYLPKGQSGVVVFGVYGGRQAAMKFMNSLQLATIAVHVADAHTMVLHPASTTHRQLTDEQCIAAGVRPELIRLSVGLEHIDDILADLAQALEKIK